MIFALGMASYGAASLLTKARAISVVPLLLGLLGAAAVRPHYAGIAAIALVCAFIIKKPAASLGSLAPLAKLAAIAGVLVMAAFLLQRTSAFLDRSGVDVQGGLTSIAGVRDALGSVSVQTEQGGSEFQAPGLTTPTGIALSVPTVLFRPLPFEAGEAQIMMSALESTALLLFALIRWRWIWTVAQKHPPATLHGLPRSPSSSGGSSCCRASPTSGSSRANARSSFRPCWRC